MFIKLSIIKCVKLKSGKVVGDTGNEINCRQRAALVSLTQAVDTAVTLLVSHSSPAHYAPRQDLLNGHLTGSLLFLEQGGRT